MRRGVAEDGAQLSERQLERPSGTERVDALGVRARTEETSAGSPLIRWTSTQSGSRNGGRLGI
jgi:hypothetical protein